MTTPFKILLVEDNSDDEQLAVRELRKFGDKVTTSVVRDGRQALDLLFDESQPLPDLVLLDLKLPFVNGLEVLSSLRSHERTLNLSVVVLTSPYEPDEVRSQYLSHTNISIRKPVNARELSEIVSQLGLGGLDLGYMS